MQVSATLRLLPGESPYVVGKDQDFLLEQFGAATMTRPGGPWLVQFQRVEPDFAPPLTLSRLYRRLGHLDQPAGLHLVDIPVDRHASGDERVRADAGDVGSDALSLILDGEPID